MCGLFPDECGTLPSSGQTTTLKMWTFCFSLIWRPAPPAHPRAPRPTRGAPAGPKWVGPSRAQVGGPKPGPGGWAQAGPKWVGPGRAQVGGPKLGPHGGPKLGPSGWAQAGPKWVGPSWAHVGGPKPGPSGWAHAGPKCPLGIEVEKQGFRTAWLITGQKFP